MATHRIRVTRAAIDDLDAIFNYIAIEDQQAALQMLERIERRIQALAGAPYAGAAVSTDQLLMIEAGYRYASVPPYLVFYRVRGDEVHIGRVLHSRQDWLQMVFETTSHRAD